MQALDTKLLRDLSRMKVQVLAIAMVMACGVAVIILALGAYRSIDETRVAYYERQGFADVFSPLVRAPNYLKARIQLIHGVSSVELRIVDAAIANVPGMSEPATAMLMSLPDSRESTINRPYVRLGRLPRADGNYEVAVIETFAEAHQMVPGDTISVLMNGVKRTLSIVGLVMSPESVYSIGPGDMMPDNRRFGVFYLSEHVLAAAFDMQGAFNDVSLTTVRGADLRAVIDSLDTLLEPYGGGRAYERKDQTSHSFLDNELVQLKGMAQIIPPVFLLVAAFLVNMILSRLIALEREQIGLLKALGYGNMSVGWHYGKLVILICLIGVIIGSILGTWMGQNLTRLYTEFYTFPYLIFRRGIDLYLISAIVTILAAAAGAGKALWQSVTLPPAVAMRPPAPPQYRSFFLDWFQSLGVITPLSVMALRHLLRWPLRSAMTIFGTSLSVALLVASLFSFDSMDFMIDTLFYKANREDATIIFDRDQAPSALSAVNRLPGVIKAEPFRQTSVLMRSAHRERTVSLLGIPHDSELARVLDQQFNPMPPMPKGLMLSDRLADIFHVRVGDMLDVELTEYNHRQVQLPVSAVVQGFIGLMVYVHQDELDRLLMQGPRISGVRIATDSMKLDTLYRAVKETPGLASIALLDISRQLFQDTIEENISISMTIYIVLGVIITFGVIYNSARIQLSERARELASLRVFGFTQWEVASVLLVELSVIVLLAQPLGWIIGYLLSWSITEGISSDLYRIPLIVKSGTYAIASLVVLIAASLSALIVTRRVLNLDMVRVLKSRE